MAKEIVERVETPLVTPADAELVVEMIKNFEHFKKKALNEKDFVDIQGKAYVKKSGWSKWALGCNISTEMKEEKIEERDGNRIYHFVYRAIHLPTGRYADAVGSASEKEKPSWNHPEHDVRSLAQTRAFNRSISNLVGGGELSAEEMLAGNDKPRKQVSAEQTPSTTPKVTVGIVADKLRHHFPNADELVEVKQTLSGIEVHKKNFLANDVWYEFNQVIRSMGGEWLKGEGCWLIKVP